MSVPANNTGGKRDWKESDSLRWIGSVSLVDWLHFSEYILQSPSLHYIGNSSRAPFKPAGYACKSHF